MDGQIYVSGFGGDASFHTYDWSTGARDTSGITNLPVGIYTVTITDAVGCTGVETYELTAPPAIVIDTAYATGEISMNPGFNGYGVNCHGNNNGQIWFAISGGTGSHSYLWSNGETTNTGITNLTVGTYTLTVTDDLGCTATASYEITQPDTLIASIAGQTSVLCFGDSTGTATVGGTGGSGGYTFEWNDDNSQTTATATNLPVGNYIVTISDSNNCEATTSVSITEPLALGISITSQTNVDCNGNSTGEATATGNNGTPNYTYEWSDPLSQTNATATGLAQGIYTVTVTDANLCEATTTVTITEPVTLSASIIGQTNVDCNGNNSGSATAAGVDGTAGYTYEWSDPSSQTTATATNLSQGTYTVTVTDAQLCEATTTVTITEPISLSATITSQTNVDCNGNSTGSATAVGVDGTADYTYEWSDPSSQTTATATNLSEGTYTVTVTDANLCEATTTVTITEFSILQASITGQTNVDCNGNFTGEATAAGVGGSGGYTYEWSDPSSQSTATATSLPNNTYTVTITDSNNCTATTSVIITEPSILSVSITAQTPADCNGTSTGSATAEGAGGAGGYTYSWSDPLSQTIATATSLAATTYTVTVTDANLCTATTSVIITEPITLTVSITSQTNIDCNGNSTGSATALGADGNGGYTYEWSDPLSQTTATASNLSEGTYTVTVTDSKNCEATTTVTITEPITLIASITAQTNVACNGGSTGSATAAGVDGAGGYSYEWNDINNQTSATATNLTSGTYTVTVTDANNCEATNTVTITQSSLLVANITAQTNIDCNGNNNGSATVTASDGIGPYTYEWSDPSSQTSNIASTLIAGSYTVTVTDSNNCNVTATVTITEPDELTSTISDIDIECNGDNDGSINLSPAGGTSPYTFQWNNGVAAVEDLTGLGPGTYNVTITDENNCTTTNTIEITEPPILAINTVSTNNISCNDGTDGSIEISASGGTPNYSYSWGGVDCSILTNIALGKTATQSSTDFGGVPERAIDGNTSGLYSTGSVSHTGNESEPWWQVDLQSIGNIGEVVVWNRTDACCDDRLDDIYVFVSDVPFTSNTIAATLTQPGVTNYYISTFNNPSETFNVNGTGRYVRVQKVGNSTALNLAEVQVFPSCSTSSILGDLSAGTYTVTVTDDNNCTATASYTLTESTQLELTANITDVNCYGGNDGFVIDVNVAGGTPGYSFDWNDYDTETWYPFEESTDDESGGGHHLITSNGTIQYSNDAVERNSSFLFDGNTRLRYDNTTTGFLRDAFTERTIMMWINPDDLSGIETLFAEGDDFDGMGIRLDGNSIIFQVDRLGEPDMSITINSIPDHNWHHVAFTFDNGILSAYLDGVHIGSTSSPDYTSIQFHGSAGGIGGDYGPNVFGDNVDRYEGLMDDFCLLYTSPSPRDATLSRMPSSA